MQKFPRNIEVCRGGMPVAPFRVGLCVLGLVFFGVAAVGCLVTEQIEFETEENLPPQILTTDEQTVPAFNRVVVVDLDQFTSSDGPMNSMTFQMAVSEPNVEDPVEVRILISSRLLGDKISTIPASPTSETERVHFFTLEPLLHFGIAGQCYPVEVYVSGRFLAEPGAIPATEGDVDSAVWWISTVDSTHRSVDMTACPR